MNGEFKEDESEPHEGRGTERALALPGSGGSPCSRLSAAAQRGCVFSHIVTPLQFSLREAPCDFGFTRYSLTHTPHTLYAFLSSGLGPWDLSTWVWVCLPGCPLHRWEDSLLLAVLILGWLEKEMEQRPDVLWMVVSFA